MIADVIQKLQSYRYRIIVIDDGSKTNLYHTLKKLPVYFLRHQINLGQGAALQTGIEFALSKNAEYIVSFDADGQHQPADIDNLIQPLLNNEADIVLGSRFIRGATHNMPAARKIFLQIARYLNYIFTGVLLSDAHNGLRAMNRNAASGIKIQENRMAHATELLSQIRKTHLRYLEVPVTIQYTPYSKEKGQKLVNSFRIFFDLILNKIFK